MSTIATNKLLRRYLNGELTAPEEAELERRAGQDPVLAEAMAGLRSRPEADHAGRVANMIKTARGKVETQAAVVRPLQTPRRRPYLAVAAALLALIAAVALWPNFSPEGAGDLAMQTEATPEPIAFKEALPPPVVEPEIIPLPETKDAGAPAETITSPAPSSTSSHPRAAARQAPPTPKAAPEEEAVELDVVTEEVVTNAAPSPPPPSQPLPAPALTTPSLAEDNLERKAAEAHAEADRAAAAKQEQRERFRREIAAGSDDLSRLIIGRITNENGEPIEQALVRLPGLPLGQRTDTSGIFRLEVDAVASLLEISHPAFKDEKLELPKANEDLQITLEEKKDRDAFGDPGAWGITKVPLNNAPGYAVPEEGFNSLRTRIENKPPAGVDKGKIKFSFLVHPDGTMSDFIFRGQPSQETMDYVGETIMKTSIWQVFQSEDPVRVYFKVVFK